MQLEHLEEPAGTRFQVTKGWGDLPRNSVPSGLVFGPFLRFLVKCYPRALTQ